MRLPWKPIKEYHYEMGTVLVWVSWSEYNVAAQYFDTTGDWALAYGVAVRGTMTWLSVDTGRPIESYGRTITYFIQKESPT